jgi:hypothetical protein
VEYRPPGGVLLDMRTRVLTITETPLRMEAVTADPFIAGLEPARVRPRPRRADRPRSVRPPGRRGAPLPSR